MKHVYKLLSIFMMLVMLLSVCSAYTVTSQAENIIRKVYEPSTGLVAPPTVIQTVDTSAKLSALGMQFLLPA